MDQALQPNQCPRTRWYSGQSRSININSNKFCNQPEYLEMVIPSRGWVLCGGCIYYIQRSNLPESHYAITPYWHTAPHLSLPTTAPGRQVYQARAAIRLSLMGTACNPSFQIVTKIQVLIHNLSYIYTWKKNSEMQFWAWNIQWS
jgi:hypothetical protein